MPEAQTTSDSKKGNGGAGLAKTSYTCKMNDLVKSWIQVMFVLLFGLLPIPSLAQCSDPYCKNLQTILDAAVTDFRVYRLNKEVGPDVSIEGTKVPCQPSTWANNVPMYICYAQVPSPDSQRWFARTLQALQSLNPAWHFQINSPGENHYVDAGPPDCEITPTEGPYIGQCPLHLQVEKQGDGTAKVYLWMNSLSSSYLLKHATAPASKTVPPSLDGCDDFCQSLKKALEARLNAFADIRTVKSDGRTAGATVRLGGAKECIVNEAAEPRPNQIGTQFVCYWRETSGSVAEKRFRDLVSRLQVLIPSTWSTHQETEMDDFTGADMTAWRAVEPGGKHDVRVYVSGESVGLHITAWN
jgi:hypothetical protein